MTSVQLHQCGCGQHDHQAVANRTVSCPGSIDMHCHVFVAEVAQRIAGMPQQLQEQNTFAAEMGAQSIEHNRRVMLPAVQASLTDVATRLADMNDSGVAIQCLSPSPAQYHYWADEALSDELVGLQNQAIIALCHEWPERFVGLGAVSLQHPQLAVRQLRELMAEPCMYGVEISTRVNGVDLSDEALLPFWQCAEELGALVFIHPFSSRVDERLQPWYLSNLIGQPLETTIALSHLIFAGVLERFPALRLLAAHGGGYLPQYCGRHDKGADVRPEAAVLPKAPSEYLKQVWFDSLVFSPLALRHLVDEVGADRVVLGTDYPFDMGSDAQQPWLDVLTAQERLLVLRNNAETLLGLEPALPSELTTGQPQAVVAGKEFP